MARTIKRVNMAAIQQAPKAKRVAAYARVSCGRDAMLHSLSAQVSYYSALIQRTPGWEYVGVYADEALSGTKDTRGEFQKLLADCRAGKIDLVVTKSISRFARNTVTTLQTVREFRQLGVDVYFEEQNIHTLGEEGEFVLTLLAAYAEEEARSVSENIRWHVQSNFRQGLSWSVEMFGYRQKNSRLVIVPEEAELLRMAAKMYLAGANPQDLERAFAEAGAVGRRGAQLTGDHIVNLLCNEKTAGDMILQKTFVDDPIAKNNRKNTGERPQYYVEGSHEAILDRETYRQVLAERARRKAEGPRRHGDYPFCSRIVCGKCGGKYVHRLRGNAPYAWLCGTYNKKGKAGCDAKLIQECVLEEITAEVMGLPEFDGRAFRAEVKEIQVQDNHSLVFVFYDGRRIARTWANPDRRYGRRSKSCQQ